VARGLRRRLRYPSRAVAANASNAMPLANPHAGRYRPDIDGLRAIAILSVLAFHAFPAALPGGFVGVDVFFVISGYLITGLLLDDLAIGRFSLVDFYKRRIRRIFPALLVVLIACLAYGWVEMRTVVYAQLGKHVAAGAGFVANLLLWSEAGYFDNVSASKPLLHLWSLGIEEQFYLAWPLLLWLLWRFRHLRIAIGLLLCASLALGLWLARTSPSPRSIRPCRGSGNSRPARSWPRRCAIHGKRMARSARFPCSRHRCRCSGSR